MLEIKDNYFINKFSKDNSPVLTCEDGDIIKFYTRDCFNNGDKKHSNPSTGPLYINGLKEGDVLAVDILDIEVNTHGVACTLEDVGVLWPTVEERTKNLKL